MQRLVYIATLLLVFGIPATQFPISDTVGSVNRLLGFVVLIGWLLSVAVIGAHRRLHPFHVLAYAFILWNIISLIWTVDPENGAVKLQRYVQSIGITLILWDVLRTRARIETGMQVLILGGYAAIALTVQDFQAGLTQFAAHGRFAASGFNPNDLGVQLAVVIPFALHLFVTKRSGNPVLRFLNGLYPIATLFAIVLTGSRGALIAALPGFLFWIWSFGKVRLGGRIALGLSLLAGVIVFMQMEVQTGIERLSTVVGAAEGDRFTGRLDIWEAGVKVFLEHPLLGVGVGGFPAAVVRYLNRPLVAHNLYLSVLGENGIVGFCLFMGIVVLVLRSTMKYRTQERKLWLGALMSWAIGVFSLTWEYVPQTWMLFAFVLACSSQDVESESASESVPRFPPSMAEQSVLPKRRGAAEEIA